MLDGFRGSERQWAKVIAMAWLDESFKKRLLTDPTTVLKEHGIELPHGLKVNLLEGKPGEINVTLPPRPDTAAGSVEELEEKTQPTTSFLAVLSGVIRSLIYFGLWVTDGCQVAPH